MTTPDSVKQTTRRQFLRASTAAAALGFSAPAILRGRNLNEKLDIGIWDKKRQLAFDCSPGLIPRIPHSGICV